MINSLFWRNRPALRSSFEIVYSNSGLLFNATSNLFRSSENGIRYFNDLLDDSRHNDRESNL